MRTGDAVGRTSAVAILGRLIQVQRRNLPPALARFLLTLGFDTADQARMEHLAARNQEGTLSADEREELFNYVKAGHLLAFLQSKPRKALPRKVS
jgi:hypothetical protein